MKKALGAKDFSTSRTKKSYGRIEHIAMAHLLVLRLSGLICSTTFACRLCRPPNQRDLYGTRYFAVKAHRALNSPHRVNPCGYIYPSKALLVRGH